MPSIPAGSPVRALWPLPLLAGLVPCVAALAAYTLSIREGLAPACNPLAEGCVSISRAARHGLPNILFRGALLPAAVLQWLAWLLCPAWLLAIGAGSTRWTRLLPVLGAVAAVLLVTYGTLLGTEGDAYRWMRRHGVRWYFVLTCVGMLAVSLRASRRLLAEPGVDRPLGWALRGLCVAIAVLGAAYLAVLLAGADIDGLGAAENVAEWWAGVLFTIFFLLLAAGWHRAGLCIEVRAGARELGVAAGGPGGGPSRAPRR